MIRILIFSPNAIMCIVQNFREHLYEVLMTLTSGFSPCSLEYRNKISSEKLSEIISDRTQKWSKPQWDWERASHSVDKKIGFEGRGGARVNEGIRLWSWHGGRYWAWSRSITYSDLHFRSVTLVGSLVGEQLREKTAESQKRASEGILQRPRHEFRKSWIQTTAVELEKGRKIQYLVDKIYWALLLV